MKRLDYLRRFKLHKKLLAILPALSESSFVGPIIILALSVATLAWAMVHYLQIAAFWPLNISLIYFVASCLLTLCLPEFASLFVFFLLPLTGALHSQVEALFGVPIAAIHHPGLDLALGWSLCYLWVFRADRSLKTSWRGSRYFYALILFVLLSVSMALLRNLWQSASLFSLKGFTLNFKGARLLDWDNDYFPLKDFFTFLVFFISFRAFLLFQNRRADLVKLLIPIVFLSLTVCELFAFFQYFFGGGYFKYGVANAVNSFMPDRHTFASFCFLGIVLPLSYLRGRGIGTKIFCLLLFASSLCAIGISQSKFTQVATAFFLLAVFFIEMKALGCLWLSLLGLLFTALLFMSVDFWWIRSVSPSFLGYIEWAAELEVSKLNSLLSFRPEIFLQAFRNFYDFPFWGLGQGVFNRMSGISAYSQSKFLISQGGENAHNYFLQTLAELGLIGFGLWFAFIASSFSGRKSRNAQLMKLAVLSLFVGNLYAHSFLERENLIYLGFFLAVLTCLPRVSDKICSSYRRLSGCFRYKKLFVLVFLLFLPLEIVSSFSKLPFTYGFLCYLDKGIMEDGWTSGYLKVDFPASKQGVLIKFNPWQQNIENHPLSLEFGYLDQNDTIHILNRGEYSSSQNHELRLKAESKTPKAFFLKTSRCMVPKNLSRNQDPRQLGIHLESLEFF